MREKEQVCSVKESRWQCGQLVVSPGVEEAADLFVVCKCQCRSIRCVCPALADHQYRRASSCYPRRPL
jgi:hypothetical protein